MWSDQGKVAPTQVGVTLNEQENGPAAGQLSGRVCAEVVDGRLLPAGRQYCGTTDP